MVRQTMQRLTYLSQVIILMFNSLIFVYNTWYIVKEFKIIIDDSFEFFIHKNDIIEHIKLPNIIQLDSFADTFTVVKRVIDFYREFKHDVYDITRLSNSVIKELSIEMKDNNTIFREYLWHKDNMFEIIQIENNVSLDEFQENNLINKEMALFLRRNNFGIFRFNRV